MNLTQIVERAKQNDESAFETLYNMTVKKGYFIALKYMNDEETAKDVLQNAYIKVFQKLNHLQDPDKFENFLYTAIAREAINFMKSKEEIHKAKNVNEFEDRKGISSFVDAIEETSQEFHPESALDYAWLKKAINDLINELPLQQKMVILMYYFEELSLNEIADALNITTNTVKSRLRYGKEKMKQRIESLQKEGKPIFNIAPIPFLIWMLEDEMEQMPKPDVTYAKVHDQMLQKHNRYHRKKRRHFITKVILFTTTLSVIFTGLYFFVVNNETTVSKFTKEFDQYTQYNHFVCVEKNDGGDFYTHYYALKNDTEKGYYTVRCSYDSYTGYFVMIHGEKGCSLSEDSESLTDMKGSRYLDCYTYIETENSNTFIRNLLSLRNDYKDIKIEKEDGKTTHSASLDNDKQECFKIVFETDKITHTTISTVDHVEYISTVEYIFNNVDSDYLENAMHDIKACDNLSRAEVKQKIGQFIEQNKERYTY